ncbi:hypothetical protein ACFSHQ_01350 [Gemmobacter lanyuensis]
MGIRKVLISKLASGLCAFGQIISDVKYNYMAPAAARLEGAEAAAKLDTLFNGLEARGRDDLKADGFTEDRISIRRSLDMRYVGQVHECTVDVDPFPVTEAALERLKAAFHARHEELYTYAEPNSAVEVVNVESAITGSVDKPGRMSVAPGKGAHAALKGTREMIFNAEGLAHETPVYDGALLGRATASPAPP